MARIITTFGFTWATNGFEVKPFVAGEQSANSVQTAAPSAAKADRAAARHAYPRASRRRCAVLFVFRAINFCALGAIFLAPFWTFNSSLDRLLPHPSGAGDPTGIALPAGATASVYRERMLVDLANLKEEIRADMCRRDAYTFCAFDICPLRVAAGRCQQK